MVKKKIIATAITGIMMLQSILPICSFAESSTTVHEISTKEQLVAFANSVNSGNTYEGETVVLKADINLNGSESNQWTPIGTSSTRFEGTFDGQNHKIENMYLNNVGLQEDQGLFGVNYGTIKNLKVVNATIKDGNRNTGVIAGINVGRIENCGNDGSTVTVTTGNRSIITDGSTRTDICIGGIVGNNSRFIDKCYNKAIINSNKIIEYNSNDYVHVGGIAGIQPGFEGNIISNCYNEMNISSDGYLGGIVGHVGANSFESTSIINSYNKGDLSSKGSESATIGGIAGMYYIGEVKNCYNEGNLTNSSGDYAGGIIGDTYTYVTIESCYNSGDISARGAGGISAHSGPGTQIISCFNKGTITGNSALGGIVFLHYGNIKNSYNIGKIISDGDADANMIGSIVGDNKEGATIENSYYKNDTYSVGVGRKTGGTVEVTPKSETEMKTQAFVTALNNGGEYFVQDINNQNNGYPMLKDKTPPILTVQYSTTAITDQDVTVTIIADEALQAVPGWNLSSDKLSLTKVYSENTTEDVIVKDLAGNTATATISISNIHKNETITFAEANMYNAVVENLTGKIVEKNDSRHSVTISKTNLQNVTYLDLSDKNIVNISGIEKFTNLKELNLFKNKITDVTPLNNNATIEKLSLNSNELDNEELNKIATMSNLKILAISNMKNITNIAPIFNMTQLQELYAYSNSITDITGIENLTNLQKLDLRWNSILQFPTINGIPDENLNVGNQRYIDTVINSLTDKIEISLPQAFMQAKDSESMYYSQNGFTLRNCEWNSDKTKIIVDTQIVAIANAGIEINSGKLSGTSLYIYGVGVTYNVNSTEAILNTIDIDLNSDGQVTLDDVQLMRTYIDNKDSLTQEQIEKIEKVDVNFDDKINEIDYNRFYRYVNKDSDILFLALIDTTQKTNKDVIAQVYTLSDDYILNDEMHIFTENGEHEFTIVDKNGNQQVLLASVNCIDKQAPEYEIFYSTQEPTNQSVTVTIVASEELLDMYNDYEDEYGEIISSGWTLSEDKTTLQKVYTENKKESVSLLDEAGNVTTLEVNVNNISKEAPDSGNLIMKLESANGDDYEQNTWTNKNVYIELDEQSKPVNSTMKYQINGQGEHTQSQILSQDGEYTITVITTDTFGNTTTTNYIIKIDKTAPTNSELQVRLESSVGDVLQNGNTTNQNVYVGINEGEDNLSGIARAYYILNGENEIEDSHIYSESGNYQMKLVVIDKAGNTKESNYNFTIDKTAPKLRTEYVENLDGSITVKIISDKQIRAIEGWNLSGNKLTLSKTYSVNKTETLTIFDLLGNSVDITIQITGINIKTFAIDVSYSTKDITNQNVLVTITSTLPMKQLSGWNLDTTKCIQTKEFSSNTTQLIIVESTEGVTAQEEIHITNIDKQAPLIRVNCSNLGVTNQDVIVKIISNEELQPLSGWVLSTDKKILQKTYGQNTNQTIVVKDLAGNEARVTVQITNIDKTAPGIRVDYSNSEATNQDVIVKIISNEELQPLSGWTLSTDKKTLQKTYGQNTNQTIVVRDLAGNETRATVQITNIDKTAPSASVAYSTKEETYSSVTVTITSNEKLKPLSGWTLSSDKLKLTKIFTKNTTQTIVIQDLVGNTANVKIDIKNIKVKQELSTDVYTITKDNYVLGIQPNTKIGDFYKNLGITKENPETGIIKTGMTMKFNDVTYTLIVVGDINKDGELDTIDLSRILFHIAEIQGETLTGVNLKAADMNLDGKVDTVDLSRMCLKMTNLGD